MSAKTIAEEVKVLKKRLTALEAKVATKPSEGWRDAFGAMKGDPLHRKAAKLGVLWRAKENKRK